MTAFTGRPENVLTCFTGIAPILTATMPIITLDARLTDKETLFVFSTCPRRRQWGWGSQPRLTPVWAQTRAHPQPQPPHLIGQSLVTHGLLIPSVLCNGYLANSLQGGSLLPVLLSCCRRPCWWLARTGSFRGFLSHLPKQVFHSRFLLQRKNPKLRNVTCPRHSSSQLMEFRLSVFQEFLHPGRNPVGNIFYSKRLFFLWKRLFPLHISKVHYLSPSFLLSFTAVNYFPFCQKDSVLNIQALVPLTCCSYRFSSINCWPCHQALLNAGCLPGAPIVPSQEGTIG